MSFRFLPKRFALCAAGLLAVPVASVCFAAAPPPLGYVGPVESDEATATTSAPVATLHPPLLSAVKAKKTVDVSAPPLGYVGPVEHETPASAPALPPLGYTGQAPVLPARTAQVAPPPRTGSLGTLNLKDAAPAVKVAEATPIATPPLGYTGPAPVLSAPTKHPDAPMRDATPRVAAPLRADAEDVPNDHDGETLISAKTMHSDSATGIMVATGKVEIVHSDYILHADKVTYNQNTGVMTADGHVALLSPGGEVQFSEHQEVTGDMKQAFARDVGVLFPDNSRLAASSAQRFDERYTVAEHAAYTACNVCKDHPEQSPLWQLHAGTITHDNVDHSIAYHDAVISVADVPVLYTPYISGPDPSVKRKEGFLSPMPGVSPNIGAFIKTPYYFDLAPDHDMTISPTVSANDKLQVAMQYRQRLDSSKFTIDGSTTYTTLIDDSGQDKGKQWRGHVFGTFLTNIDPVWRAGTDIQYASDKSYLHRYNISSIDQTTSRAFVEGFHGRDYAVVNSYYFQDLRAGTDAAEPIVTPSAAFSLLGNPGQTLGGRWSLDGNTLVTSRDNAGKALAAQGPNTRRLSLNAGWKRQLISDTGFVTTVSGLLRSDNYWANNVVSHDATQVYDRAVFSRQFVQGNAIVRYPMARTGNGYQQLAEPIVAFTAAPKVRSIAKQPIEDSLDVEFDETNLFSPNRFTGSDLIEDGSRVTYGMRNAFTLTSGAHVGFFGGQSYRLTESSAFSDTSGLNHTASDYVGRVDFAPAPWFTANYGFRLDRNTGAPQRQDALVTFGVPQFRPSLRYIEGYSNDTAGDGLQLVRQVTLSFSSKFADYWMISGAHTHAFDPQPGSRGSSVAVTYVDECFAYGVNLSRDDTVRADISTGTSIAFHFYLRNLGGLHTDSTSSINFPAEFRQNNN